MLATEVCFIWFKSDYVWEQAFNHWCIFQFWCCWLHPCKLWIIWISLSKRRCLYNIKSAIDLLAIQQKNLKWVLLLYISVNNVWLRVSELLSLLCKFGNCTECRQINSILIPFKIAKGSFGIICIIQIGGYVLWPTAEWLHQRAISWMVVKFLVSRVVLCIIVVEFFWSIV